MQRSVFDAETRSTRWSVGLDALDVDKVSVWPSIAELIDRARGEQSRGDFLVTCTMRFLMARASMAGQYEEANDHFRVIRVYETQKCLPTPEVSPAPAGRVVKTTERVSDSAMRALVGAPKAPR